MALSPAEEIKVLSYIPTQPNLDPLYDVGYHESKIGFALTFKPDFTRAEAWALSMYLGPAYYCQGINRALLNLPMASDEKGKFLLIAKAAQSALEKLPPLTSQSLEQLPQPDERLPPTSYLKRFVHYPNEILAHYQVGQIRQEPNFFSTTYWQAPIGQLQQYADRANTVFHVHILAFQSWGKYVDGIKRQAREGEILFPPGTSFRVTQRETADYPINISGMNHRRMNIINLQEVKRNADEREI